MDFSPDFVKLLLDRVHSLLWFGEPNNKLACTACKIPLLVLMKKPGSGSRLKPTRIRNTPLIEPITWTALIDTVEVLSSITQPNFKLLSFLKMLLTDYNEWVSNLLHFIISCYPTFELCFQFRHVKYRYPSNFTRKHVQFWCERLIMKWGGDEKASSFSINCLVIHIKLVVEVRTCY